MIKKSSVVIPEQYYKGVQILPPEQRGEAYEAYLEYAFYGKEYEGSNITIRALFASVVDSIDTANANYDKKMQALEEINETRKNKAKGRRNNVTSRNDNDTSRIDNVTSRNDNDTSRIDNVSNSVTVTVTDTVSKEKGDTYVSQKKKAVRPTLEEVKEYALEKTRPEEAEPFYDFYESNGWKVGKNPMRDWQASFRSWLRRNFDRGKKNKDDGLEELMAAEVAKEKAENDARGVQPFGWDAEDISGVHNTGNLFRVV